MFFLFRIEHQKRNNHFFKWNSAVLIGVFVEQSWLSREWQAVGGGQIVDIRFVDVHRVSAYVSKYLTKDLLLQVPAKKKRISTSRDIRLFDKKAPSGLQWSRDPIRKPFFRLSHSRTCTVFNVQLDDGGLLSFSVEGVASSPVQRRNERDGE